MFQVYALPAFTDNYFWLIQPDDQHRSCYIVDPGDATVVIQAINQRQLDLKAVLLTHHHHDHIDGAVELSVRYKIPIYGPQSEKIPCVTHPLFEGDQLTFDKNTRAIIFEIPGHTRDHIAYYFESETPKLFSADTIFSAGCGRIFDGDAESLFKSIERLKKLPSNTLIYAAHEYTQANLKFAQFIEPWNQEIRNYQTYVTQQREQKISTLPTSLARELLINPFLHCRQPEVKNSVSEKSGLKLSEGYETFREMRLLKNSFQ